jgi:hypothetical protein
MVKDINMSYHSPRVFRLNGSVGECGTNNPEDVKLLQSMIIDAGYNDISDQPIRPNGRCDKETQYAIHWLQRLQNMAPSGLLHPMETWFYGMFMNAITPHWRPRHTTGPLHVREGQLTFDAEGVDYITAVAPFRQPQQMPNFSRILHWPGSASGVTIGRGYDMKNRSAGQIQIEMRLAGIEEYKAIICSKAAHLAGREASNFVKDYGTFVGEITHIQQIRLFETIYPDYIKLSAYYYKKYTTDKFYIPDAIQWDRMDKQIKSVYVDISYQGVENIRTLTACVARNDKKRLIEFIRNSTFYMSYESNRKRINYLK